MRANAKVQPDAERNLIVKEEKALSVKREMMQIVAELLRVR